MKNRISNRLYAVRCNATGYARTFYFRTESKAREFLIDCWGMGYGADYVGSVRFKTINELEWALDQTAAQTAYEL